jgi:hypothetical protein
MTTTIAFMLGFALGAAVQSVLNWVDWRRK